MDPLLIGLLDPDLHYLSKIFKKLKKVQFFIILLIFLLVDHIFFQRPTKMSKQDPYPARSVIIRPPASGSLFVNQDYGSERNIYGSTILAEQYYPK